ARQRWPDRGIEWVAVPGGGALPFADASFDLVLSSSVLEYVEDVPRALGEFARILRPGAWCCATVPDMRHALRRGETLPRRTALNPLLLALARLSPWRSTYEYLRLSINRFPIADWAALFVAAGLDPIVPEHCEHPLALIAAQRRAAGERPSS